MAQIRKIKKDFDKKFDKKTNFGFGEPLISKLKQMNEALKKAIVDYQLKQGLKKLILDGSVEPAQYAKIAQQLEKRMKDGDKKVFEILNKIKNKNLVQNTSTKGLCAFSELLLHIYLFSPLNEDVKNELLSILVTNPKGYAYPLINFATQLSRIADVNRDSYK